MSDEIVISAVTYPLGNDADEATGFLKYTVINNVLQHSPLSLGESISRGLLTGKGIQLLRNYEYARRKFSLGLPHSGLSYSSPTKLRTPLINVLKSLHPGHDIQLQGTEVGPCRFSNWCMRYLEENYGYDPELGFTRPPENTAPDAPVSCDYQFINPGVDSWGNPYWIYNSSISAGLTVMWENKAGEVKGVMFNPNLWPMPREAKDNPADTFWPNFTSLQTAYRTIKTYPTSTTRSTRAKLESDFDHVSTVVSQVVRNGDIQETITVTTMTVSGNTTTLLVEKTVKVISRMKYYFYWVDTAPGAPGYQSALDNWLSKIPYSSPYFPSVPLRVNNQDMTTEDKRDTSLYKTSKKLLDKFNIDILELADQINDNESIKDIDYAHVMFGVPIHAEAPECLEYLWRFFTDLQGLDPGEFTDPPFDPDNGDYYHPDMSVLHIFYQQAPHDYPNIRIRWRWIERSLFDGVIAPGAKPGDIKMVLGAKATRVFKYHSPEKGKREVSEDDSTIYLRRQLDASNYEELEIRGLVYNNYIYGGKWQVTAAWDQINDPEEVSGFLVPLNQQVLRALPLPVVTDLAYHVPHIVFNCYTKVKKKWYQQGWFKYLMIIIAVVITVMTAGADGGGSLGYALAYSAVAATGVTGVLLTYLAHALFAIAMMIISTVIAKVSTELFGDKWGAVIGAIVMIAVGSYASTGSFTAGFGVSAGGLTAQSILQATQAILKVGQAYNQGTIAELQDEVAAAQADYEAQMDTLEELNKQLDAGRHTDVIDVQGLTDSFDQFFESMDTFLTRTLMTGSDVCEVTSGLVDNFVELGLRLPTT